MGMNIFVGNLSFSATEDDLRSVFSAHGQVSSVKVVKDRDTGRSKGFGFVVMPTDEEGQQAIAAVNGKEIAGRQVRCDVARPMEQRPRN